MLLLLYPLGDSKASCLSVVDAVLDNLGQPLVKKRDIDMINYSYATVGYLNRRMNSGGISRQLR